MVRFMLMKGLVETASLLPQAKLEEKLRVVLAHEEDVVNNKKTAVPTMRIMIAQALPEVAPKVSADDRKQLQDWLTRVKVDMSCIDAVKKEMEMRCIEAVIHAVQDALDDPRLW